MNAFFSHGSYCSLWNFLFINVADMPYSTQNLKTLLLIICSELGLKNIFLTSKKKICHRMKLKRKSVADPKKPK